MNVSFLPWYPTNPYQEQLAENLEQLGAEVTLLSLRSFSRPGSAFKVRADVLHLHWVQGFVIARNIVVAWIKLAVFLVQLVFVKWRGVKLVWTIHELRDHERQNPLLDRLCTRGVSRLCHTAIVHCEAAKRIAVDELGIAPDRLNVVPLGNYIGCYANEISRNAARRSLGIPEDSLVFLFIGLIKPYKGVLELIDAFTRIDHDDVFLVIAGRPYREAFGETIRAKVEGRPNVKFFPEFMPDEKIQVYLNACNCTVFPYRHVLSSSSVLLSMTFARACVAPKIGCVAEDLDEVGSILYDPEAHDALYDALQRAIERRTDLTRMGEHNHDLALRASWDRIAEKTLAVYSSTLPRRR
jgi:glycosyltransferase involved in cell wall biosynthesis